MSHKNHASGYTQCAQVVDNCTNTEETGIFTQTVSIWHKNEGSYSILKRSQLYLLIAIAVVIFLQIAQQIQIYQTQGESGQITLPPLVWRQTPGCWASSGLFRFKLEQCGQLSEGTVISVIGRVAPESDGAFFTQKRLIKTTYTEILPNSTSPLYWRSRVVRWSDSARTWLVTPVHQTVAYPEEVLVESFVLGSGVELPESIEHSVKVMGIAHVIAVSGSHLTLLIALLLPIVQTNKSTINTVIIVIFLVVYATLVGWQPAVSRALWMSVILMMGKTVFHRQVSLGRSLAVSAVVMIVLDPWVLLNIGWQLSVFATAGICWVYPILQERFSSRGRRPDLSEALEEKSGHVRRTLKRAIGSMARLSLEAWLASVAALSLIWPIMIVNFGTWSWGGLVSSLLLWWLFPLVISSCFVGVIVIRALTLVSVYPPLLQICSSLLLEWPVRSVTWLFERVDTLEWMVIEPEQLDPAWYVLWYLGVGVVTYLHWRRARLHIWRRALRLQPLRDPNAVLHKPILASSLEKNAHVAATTQQNSRLSSTFQECALVLPTPV